MIALSELGTVLDTSFILPEAQKHWYPVGDKTDQAIPEHFRSRIYKDLY